MTTTPEPITVVFYEVNQGPVVMSVPNDLAAFQRLVSGYIELLGLQGEIYLVCNEEGQREELRPNRVIRGGEVILGNCFITAISRSFHRSLTANEVSWVISELDGTGVFHGV